MNSTNHTAKMRMFHEDNDNFQHRTVRFKLNVQDNETDFFSFYILSTKYLT